jgi:hypothetical protein
MKFIPLLLALVISFAANAQKRGTNYLAQKIVGTWLQSNSFYYTKFTPTNEFDYAGGKIQAAYDYRIAGDTLIAVEKTKGTVYKWIILKLTSNDLSMKWVDSGYIANFKRKKIKNSN